jgi:hypothetical protein
MEESELRSIVASGEDGKDNMLISNLLICEPEVEKIQKTINEHI